MKKQQRRKRQIKRRQKENIAVEILLILTVIFLFMTAACVNKKEMAEAHELAFLATGIADAGIILAWIGILIFSLRKFVKGGRGFADIWRKNRGVYFSLLFCCGVRLMQFGDTPRWDSLTYYRMLRSACDNFDFTLLSFWQNFSLANHPTLGYAGITAIGEFFNPGGYVGVIAVWMAVTLFATFCIYRILEKVLPACSWAYHAMATCIVMCTPLVLGTFSYYQPDAGAVCFFVFAVYCYLYKQNVLMFFSIVLLLMTKEIGVVILGGFGLGALLGRVLYIGRERTAGKRFLNFFREPLGISAILGVIGLSAYFVVYLKNGGTIWSISNEDLEGFSTVRFMPSFIAYKAKQFFVLNFNWLIWGGNLLMFFLVKLKKSLGGRRYTKLKRRDIVLVFFLAAFLQMGFYSLYVTYALPRYHVLIDFCGVFLFVVLLPVCAPKGIRRYAAAGVTGVLLLAEAYITIDPVSLLVFKNEDTGNGHIIREDYYDGAIQGDFCVYNHQINYLGRGYEHILRSVEYSEGMDILVWQGVDNYSVGGGGYWDTEKKKIVMAPGENTVEVRCLERESVENEETRLQEEAVFILVPQFVISEEYAENFLDQYYRIRYKGYVDIPMSGKMMFYVCDLRDLERLPDE